MASLKRFNLRLLHLTTPILHQAQPLRLKSFGHDVRCIVQQEPIFALLTFCWSFFGHLPEETAFRVGSGDIEWSFGGGKGGDDVSTFGDGLARWFLGIFQGSSLRKERGI
jgi:hypothetical protein